ncbi:MAG: hypothetical protein JWR38_175 [Mucilaginibacter sp.]|nr:hypothetical protein [Mucilaginibacter sp.]
MKIGKIPVVSIILMAVCLIRFVARHVFAINIPVFDSPFNEGLLVGVVIMDLVYRAKIWSLALKNNQQQATSTFSNLN